jgi:hypothetical protein
MSLSGVGGVVRLTWLDADADGDAAKTVPSISTMLRKVVTILGRAIRMTVIPLLGAHGTTSKY